MTTVNPIDLVQFGGVGLAAFLAWILYKIVSNHEKHFISSTKEYNENIKENTRMLTEIRDLIISLKNKK